MTDHILITGATGRVGRAIIDQMQDDERIIAGVRNIDRARQQLGADITYRTLDFADPTTYAAALHDVDALFLMWAAVDVDAVIAFADAAQQHGVRHVVFLSIFKADQLAIVPHRQIEQHLETLAMTYTFLRASYFMQNLSSIHRNDIADYHQIFIPAGKGRTSFIDVRDVAAVAMKALTEPGHANRAYSLTGTDSLTYGDAAAIMSRVLGTRIVYTDANIIDFVTRMTQTHGYAWGLALFMVIEYTAARFGFAADTTDDLMTLLDREPVSMAQFVEDYRQEWVS